MRLIDADELLTHIRDYGEGQNQLLLIDPYYVRKAPTVGQPKGKWIREDKPWGGFGDRVLVLTCSECGESFVYHGNEPKFCSECGADMRGGATNDPN